MGLNKIKGIIDRGIYYLLIGKNGLLGLEKCTEYPRVCQTAAN